MKALIVYAHPEPKSFNGAMKDLSVETLRGRGDEVEVTDLYAMRFNAVVAADDFHGERADPEFLSIAAEQTRACETGTLASDIVAEQKKLAPAEILILQFPIAKAYANTRAAELMVHEALNLYEANENAGPEANMAKMLAADASFEAANACIQTHGGFGFAEEYDVERKFRETRLYQVAPISTNLVLSYVAEHVLGMPRSY